MATIPTIPYAFNLYKPAASALGIACDAIACEVDSRPTHGKNWNLAHGRFRFLSRRNAFRALLATLDDAILASIARADAGTIGTLAACIPGLWSKAAPLAHDDASLPGILARVTGTAMEAAAAFRKGGTWEWEGVPCLPAEAGHMMATRAEAAAKAEAEAKAAEAAKAEAEAAALAKVAKAAEEWAADGTEAQAAAYDAAEAAAMEVQAAPAAPVEAAPAKGKRKGKRKA